MRCRASVIWDSDLGSEITNCPSLEIITIGRYSFSDYSGPFVIQNCNMLKQLKIGEIGSESCNFYEADFVLEGRKWDVDGM